MAKVNQPALTHTKQSAAIDHTPIHKFVVTAHLHPGDVVEWDEENVVATVISTAKDHGKQ